MRKYVVIISMFVAICAWADDRHVNGKDILDNTISPSKLNFNVITNVGVPAIWYPGFNVYGPAKTHFELLGESVMVSPKSDASGSMYILRDADIKTEVGNANDLYSLTGVRQTITSGDIAENGAIRHVESIDGIMQTVINISSAGNIKNGWFHTVNYGPVSGFVYALQANVDAWGTGSHVSDIGTVRAGRFRIQNYSSMSSASQVHIGNANAVYANIDQGQNFNSAGGTIENATGYQYDLNNMVGSTIMESHGVHITSPTGGGSIWNHYGIRVDDQTVPGAINNYALWIGGGHVSINLPVYADNMEAMLAGRRINDVYKTPTGDLKVVY